MTVPTNTDQTYTQVNIREDLGNLIHNVDPYEVPILSMAKRGKAEQTYHEWNVDVLAAQNTSNSQIEGDDATADVTNPTGRLGNYTQISRKVIQLSDTLQAVRAAGATNRMGYQIAKAAKALRKDMEGSITKNAARSAGSSSAARVLGGLPSWLVTNTVFQTGGAPSGANPTGTITVGTSTFGNGTTGRTYNSVTAAVTEAEFKTAAQDIFTNSGKMTPYAICSPKNKGIISTFTGPGTRFTQVEDKKLAAAVDVYQTDFGDVKIVPDIFLAQSGDIYFVDPDFLRIAYLRPYSIKPLADTGDSTRKMLRVEYTLEVANEHALGAIFDSTG